MKLSVSNIGWSETNDDYMYQLMKEYGFCGLEIAPTRIFPERPYEKKDKARAWGDALFADYRLSVSSMQSIWFGKSEKIFGSEYERQILMEYTKKAIDFSEAVGCANLVFGCPKNRSIPVDGDINVAVRFFRELGEYAESHHAVIAMEANSPAYNTNFLNTTYEAQIFVESAGSAGIRLNLDTGTMIESGEDISLFQGREYMIHHVHISEPGLKPIQKRKLHRELASMLKDMDYQGFVSIEVGRQDDRSELLRMMEYVKEVFE